MPSRECMKNSSGSGDFRISTSAARYKETPPPQLSSPDILNLSRSLLGGYHLKISAGLSITPSLLSQGLTTLESSAERHEYNISAHLLPTPFFFFALFLLLGHREHRVSGELWQTEQTQPLVLTALDTENTGSVGNSGRQSRHTRWS